MNDLNWLSPIEISDHARRRIEARLGYFDADLVRGEIRAGILIGRVARTLPDWARRNGHRKTETHPLSRYVWDPEATRVWVLTRRPGYLFLKTVILDRELLRIAAEHQHLRHT